MPLMYVAKGIRTVNGKALTVWLAWHEDSGGSYQWVNDHWFETAKPFLHSDDAITSAKKCPGPWYNEPDPTTIEAIKVNYIPARLASMTIWSE